MPAKFTAVLPKPFLEQAFRVEMEDTIQRLSAGIFVDFERTTSTWEEKPVFEIESNSNDRLIEAHVYCDALRDGDRVRGAKRPNPAPINLVYFFLNGGTDVRYAHMSKNFRPKTKVGIIGSFPGQGWLWKVDTNEPNPGIIAREWDKAIADKYRKIIESQLRSALYRGVRGSGHAF